MLPVMVIDDSAVSRRMLRRALEPSDDVEVVAAARNGEEALEKLEETEVDALLVDLQMPVMGGIELLRALRERSWKLPVVVVSTEASEGAPETVEALLEGADAYVLKPEASENRGIDGAVSQLREELLPCLRSVVESEAGSEAKTFEEVIPSESTGEVSTELASVSETPEPLGGVDIVGIAVSTGGPGALATVLEGLPPDFEIPVVVVQHMPAAFTAQLAERLDGTLEARVREAGDGEVLEAGTVWIAPGGRHLRVEGRSGEFRATVTDDPKVNSCRPSADVLFDSLAANAGSRALGIVMTGMGDDGLAGCRELERAGAPIIVQDRKSSVAWGMPRGPLQAGIVDCVLPLERLGTALLRAVTATSDAASRSSSG